MKRLKNIFSLKLLLISLILSGNILGSPAVMPYAFYGPGFNLIPFSQKELKTFHEKGIRRIETGDDDYKNIFLFNEKGLLAKSRYLARDRDVMRLMDSTIYSYDGGGRLVSVREKGHSASFDSISYDTAGRIIFFLSRYYMAGKKGKTDTVTQHNFHFEKTNEGEHCLFEDLGNGKSKIWLDTNNIVIKTQWGSRTDSVAFEKRNDSVRVRTYFSKDTAYSYSKKYYTGLEETYINGLPKKKVQYEIGGESIYKKEYYVYSSDKKLIQINDVWRDKILFVYNEEELIREKVFIRKGNSFTVFYEYFKAWG